MLQWLLRKEPRLPSCVRVLSRGRVPHGNDEVEGSAEERTLNESLRAIWWSLRKEPRVNQDGGIPKAYGKAVGSWFVESASGRLWRPWRDGGRRYSTDW